MYVGWRSGERCPTAANRVQNRYSSQSIAGPTGGIAGDNDVVHMVQRKTVRFEGTFSSRTVVLREIKRKQSGLGSRRGR